jgi:co-chaperonin GroES (HSP10)
MIKMRHDNLLVKRIPTPETTESGLYILGREKPQLGKVVSCGPECPGINPGDIIMFGKFTGTEIEPDTLLLKFKDCLIVIDNLNLEEPK